MGWLIRLRVWLLPKAPREPGLEVASVVHALERAAVEAVFYAAGVRCVERAHVDTIAIAARRYALAIQHHDDDLIDAREASVVEDRLRGVLHAAVRPLHPSEEWDCCEACHERLEGDVCVSYDLVHRVVRRRKWTHVED